MVIEAVTSVLLERLGCSSTGMHQITPLTKTTLSYRHTDYPACS